MFNHGFRLIRHEWIKSKTTKEHGQLRGQRTSWFNIIYHDHEYLIDISFKAGPVKKKIVKIDRMWMNLVEHGLLYKFHEWPWVTMVNHGLQPWISILDWKGPIIMF